MIWLLRAAVVTILLLVAAVAASAFMVVWSVFEAMT